MPSPKKKGIAEGATRKAKVGNVLKRNNGIPTARMANFLRGRPFPKPPAHPGRAYKETLNAKIRNEAALEKKTMRALVQSRSKPVPRAELAHAAQRVRESQERALARAAAAAAAAKRSANASTRKSPRTRPGDVLLRFYDSDQRKIVTKAVKNITGDDLAYLDMAHFAALDAYEATR